LTILMKPSEAALQCLDNAEALIPTILWGSPGIGKTETVTDVFTSHGYFVHVLHMYSLDVLDFRGYAVPSKEDGLMHFQQIANVLPRPDDKRKGILFLDEFNVAHHSIMQMALQLNTSRRIGDYKLPEGYSIIAAGNRETDRAMVNPMPSPVSARFMHIDVGVDFDDWITWARSHGMRDDLISFIRNRPELLNQFDPRSNHRVWPNPRAWAWANRAMNSRPPERQYAAVAGLVGEGAATEYIAHARLNLPDMALILNAPATAPVPSKSEVSLMYAISTKLGSLIDKDNLAAVNVYLARLPADFSIMAIRDAYNRNHAIVNCKAFAAWAAANKDVIL
jgi:MoxR-like ATPase